MCFNPLTSSLQITADALIAQKRAEIAAKLAAMKSAAPTPKPQTPATQSSHSPSPAPPAVDDLSRRVAEAQRRVAESQNRLAFKENPYMASQNEVLIVNMNSHWLQSLPQTGKRSKPAEPAQQGVGLKMAAHPLLLDTSTPMPQSKKDRYKPMQPKFASIKVGQCRTHPWPKTLTDNTRLTLEMSPRPRPCPQLPRYPQTMQIHIRLGLQLPRTIRASKEPQRSGLDGHSDSTRRGSTYRLRT